MEFPSVSIAFLLPFLGFLKLFLEKLPLGDIARQAGNTRNPAIFIPDDIAAVPDMTHLAIGTNDSIFRIVTALSGFLIKEGERALVIIRMNCIEPGVRVVVKTA